MPISDEPDAVAVRIFRERLAAGQEEFIPAEFANRIIDGENAVRVWREYRGLSARELAQDAGISAEKLQGIESGTVSETDDDIAKVAKALKLSVDDLV